ncbi:unnamed protein product [Ilex paraguariensis]|uniref:Clp R domain-containing protein n=1 Tax=Ilex paraguariensis TaxID=185542 RepID=A0ABC8TUH1_9AQUA
MAAHTVSTAPTPTRASQPDSRRPKSLSPTQFLRPHVFQSTWLGTPKLSLQSSNPRLSMPKYHRPITAIVTFSLPTAKPERVASTEKVPKWSSKAIKSFAMGELEARKLKYPTTGTEALLMGVLIEGTNFAAKYLWANGITLFKVREETVKVLGKADLYFFSPEHPPLTEAAQRALDWALDEKLKSRENGEITTTHLLLGVWSEDEGPGHKIMSALGFNNENAKELNSLVSKPDFVED